MEWKTTLFTTAALVTFAYASVTWEFSPQIEQSQSTQNKQPPPDNAHNLEPSGPLTLAKKATRSGRLQNKLPDSVDTSNAQAVLLPSVNTVNTTEYQTRTTEQISSNSINDSTHREFTSTELQSQQQVESYFNLTPSTDPTIVNSTLLENLLQDWAKSNPAAAWNWITNNDTTGTLNKYRVSVMQEWLNHNSNEAYLAINSLPTSPIRTRLIADYAAMAASYNPHQAFNWAASLTNPDEQRKALDSVVYEWASNDPIEVIAQLDSAVAPEIKRQLLYSAGPTIASNLSQIDSRRAIEWTHTLDEEHQAVLKPIAFQQWINQNSEEALDWLTNENSLANSSLYLSTSAATLPYHDLNSALVVFPHLQENIQQEMASSIAYSLYQLDKAQAQAWMYELSSPQVIDKANTGYLLATASNEPISALNMALQIYNVNKTDILATIAVEVDQQHPEALENWMANTLLSDEQLNTIRSALIRNPTD